MVLKKQEYVSIVIAVSIVITIISLILANIVKFSDVSAAIASILIAGISGVLVWGFRSRITDNTTDSMKKEESSDNTHEEKPRKQEQIEDKEKIKSKLKIHVDDYKFYEFNLKKGEKITGNISSDGLFNVYFLTRSSLRSFENESGFNPIDSIEDAHSFEPNFVAPRRDTFFTVIENADNKNIVVDIELYV